MSRTLLLCLLTTAGLVAGCGPTTVAVRISIPDDAGVETPVAGARFVALPFDRDSVLAALAAQASTPRPSTQALDSVFQRFRAPFAVYLRLAAAEERVGAARDSVRAALAALAPGAAGRPVLQARFRALEDSLGRLAPPREAARAALARARVEVLPAADSLRRALAAWEDTAYGAYDSVQTALMRARGREAVPDSTGADGWGWVRLRRGDWWISARAVNVLDPYSEWYWNVRVAGDTVRLSSANGRTRPRL